MKTYVTLALLAAACASANAQSSVTLFGVVDSNVSVVRNGAAGSVTALGTSGNETSRLGVRGIEDLGGGLAAGFELQGQLFNDTGNANGFNWQRRSTVSLISRTMGEVRLGRDYDPTYWNHYEFDPFGNNGVGSQLNMMALTQPIQVQNQSGFPGALPGAATTPLGSGAPTLVRASNSVGYFLPADLGGVYGQLMTAPSESSTGGKYSAARLGYRNGPLNIAASFGKTGLATGDLKEINTGAWYDFGFVKVMGFYGKDTFNNATGGSATQKNLLLGATLPAGPGTVRLSYNRAQIGGASTGITGLGSGSARMLAAGYVYDLSKRTALYATYARISNDPGVQFVVGANGAAMGGLTGQASSGYEMGIRHRF